MIDITMMIASTMTMIEEEEEEEVIKTGEEFGDIPTTTRSRKRRSDTLLTPTKGEETSSVLRKENEG